MTSEDKKKLLDMMNETHSATIAILEKFDLDTRVYTDSDWRGIDIIGHVATWNRQVSMSLQAYQSGKEYFIPDLDGNEDSYNQEAVIKQRELTDQQIFAEWEEAHEEVITTLQDMPLDKFPGDLLAPWGEERGSIAYLVEFMVEHEIEHRDEIVKVLQALQTD